MMRIYKLVLNIIGLAVTLVLTILAAMSDGFLFPSVYGSAGRLIEPPVTYLVALVPLLLAVLIVLSMLAPGLAKKFGAVVFWGALGLGFCVFVFI